MDDVAKAGFDAVENGLPDIVEYAPNTLLAKGGSTVDGAVSAVSAALGLGDDRRLVDGGVVNSGSGFVRITGAA